MKFYAELSSLTISWFFFLSPKEILHFSVQKKRVKGELTGYLMFKPGNAATSFKGMIEQWCWLLEGIELELHDKTVSVLNFSWMPPVAMLIIYRNEVDSRSLYLYIYIFTFPSISFRPSAWDGDLVKMYRVVSILLLLSCDNVTFLCRCQFLGSLPFMISSKKLLGFGN